MEGQILFRESVIKWAMLVQLTGLDKTIFTRGLKKRLNQQGPQGRHGDLMILWSPLARSS